MCHFTFIIIFYVILHFYLSIYNLKSFKLFFHQWRLTSLTIDTLKSGLALTSVWSNTRSTIFASTFTFRCKVNGKYRITFQGFFFFWYLRFWQYLPLYPGGHLHLFPNTLEQIPPFKHLLLHFNFPVFGGIKYPKLAEIEKKLSLKTVKTHASAPLLAYFLDPRKQDFLQSHF